MPTENKPLCSICCVGYRHAPYIEKCIRSIWANDYENMEIIALDDGSNDGSAEILEKLAKESPCPMTVAALENTGNVPMNFNRTLAAAKGEFVLFIALDDMLLPDSIKPRMELLINDDKMAFALNMQVLVKKDDDSPVHEPLPIESLEKVDAKNLLELEKTFFHSFHLPNAIFRKDIVEKVGGFNENMIGDDIILRTKILFWLLRNSDWKIGTISDPGFIYREHSQNLHKNMIRQASTVLQYVKKFWAKEPPSPVIRDWLIMAIEENDFRDSLKLFTEYQNAAPYFCDVGVSKALRKAAIRTFA